MKCERIYLMENNKDVYLDTFIPDKFENRTASAVLVIPGGGYSKVCYDREGDPIALHFAASGFNAYVLHYSVGEKALFPRPLIEASLSMKYIKDNAEKDGTDKDRVFVNGYSAGGHLCVALSCLWHLPEIYDSVDMPYGYNKPCGMLPIYPVVSGLVKGAHLGSFYNILGTQTPSFAELEKYSLETCIDEKCCPAFIAHGANDEMVSVRNSLVLANALSDYNIPYEMHIYQDALHGFALANKITGWVVPDAQNWIFDAVKWINKFDD